MDKIYTKFKNRQKGKEEISNNFLIVKEKLVQKTITDEINENTQYSAIELFPFGENKYNNLEEMLERTTSLEQRAVSFKIHEEYKEQFVKEFNNSFGNEFKLYAKSEIIKSHLFGYGDENELFRGAIGDFIAIAENSNKCIITDGDEVLKSQHAGYSDDEIYVPLIVIDKC